MKNIPLSNLFEQLSNRTGGIRWSETVRLPRLEEGLHSEEVSSTRYCAAVKETITKLTDYLQSRGYVTMRVKGIHNGVQALLMRPDEKALTAYVDVGVSSVSDHNVELDACGDAEECQALLKWFKDTFNVKGSTIMTGAELDDKGRIGWDRTFIPEGQSQVARQSFYPWLSVPIEEYADAFMASDESILVLYGPPGTAKTTFLRTIIAHGNYNAMLVYNKKVVESPALLRSFYRNDKVRILAYEDIDKHLGKREDDNALMPVLLNAADGLVQRSGKKIVFVTNLPTIDRIDPALLRAGRCFDILKFELLSPAEADTVRESMGLAPRDFSAKKGWAVAEVLANETPVQQAVNRFARKVGF